MSKIAGHDQLASPTYLNGGQSVAMRQRWGMNLVLVKQLVTENFALLLVRRFRLQ